MNPLHRHLATGTVGELIVQLRLLQYGVQAAAPLKDTGNDLIAIRGKTFRAIQVKTSGKKEPDKPVTFRWKRLPRHYHILALVALNGENNTLFLDQTDIYLLSRDKVTKKRYSQSEIEPYRLSQQLVNELFNEPSTPRP